MIELVRDSYRYRELIWPLALKELTQVEEHCDQVLLMDKGSIVAAGLPHEVIEIHEHSMALEVVGAH